VQVATNEIWVATQSGGILVLNEKKEFIRSIRQPIPATIEHLYKVSDANVWAASFNGLFKIDPLSGKVLRINNTTAKNNPQQNQCSKTFRRILCIGKHALFQPVEGDHPG